MADPALAHQSQRIEYIGISIDRNGRSSHNITDRAIETGLSLIGKPVDYIAFGKSGNAALRTGSAPIRFDARTATSRTG